MMEMLSMKIIVKSINCLKQLEQALFKAKKGEPIKLNNSVKLVKEESVIIENEIVEINAKPNTELVLFYTNAKSECYKGGMFSGNQFRL